MQSLTFKKLERGITLEEAGKIKKFRTDNFVATISKIPKENYKGGFMG